MKRYLLLTSVFKFGLVLGLAIFMSCTGAAEFSADIIQTDVAGKATAVLGKVYMTGGKARIETKNLSDGFFIVDAGKEAAFFVRPGKKIFMDAKQSSPLTQVLVPLDPLAPCQKFQAMAINAGIAPNEGQWLCRRINDAAAQQRLLTFSAISPLGTQTTVQIDPDLKALVGSQTGGGEGFVLKNIQKGPQSPDLFEISADYKKFDPRELIKILKKSDVWVEPRK